MNVKKIFTKKDPEKQFSVNLNSDSSLFLFICIVTALLSGAVKISWITAVLFTAVLYFYFYILRIIWRLIVKLLSRVVISAADLEGAGRDES